MTSKHVGVADQRRSENRRIKVTQMAYHFGEKQEAQKASQRFLGSCDSDHMDSYTRFAPLLLLLFRLSALSITTASLNQPC